MKIGNENGKSNNLMEMKEDLFAERMAFWMQLYKKYGLISWDV